MVGHGGSSAGSYLADPTSPIPSHCASIVVTSTLRVKKTCLLNLNNISQQCIYDHTERNSPLLLQGRIIILCHFLDQFLVVNIHTIKTGTGKPE